METSSDGGFGLAGQTPCNGYLVRHGLKGSGSVEMAGSGIATQIRIAGIRGRVGVSTSTKISPSALGQRVGVTEDGREMATALGNFRYVRVGASREVAKQGGAYGNPVFPYFYVLGDVLVLPLSS